MHPKNFVIWDAEQEYAKNLMQAVSSHRELGFQMHLFQDTEHLEAFSQQKQVHILLLGEDCPPEQRQLMNADRRYVLIKGENSGLLPEERGIFKYQSADRILSLILEEALDGEEIQGRFKGRGEVQLIGVYSPVHRIGKTKFALELGRELSKEGPVLYLNLEEYSGTSHYFPEETEHNLTDLLYYLRQDKANIGLRISAMAGRAGTLDYISPMPVIQDLRAVEEAEWLRLFEAIFDQSIYKSVILDLGDGVNGLYRILRECRTVYTLYTDEPVSLAKLKQYFENLRRTGYEDVLEHTIQKRVGRKAGEEA